MQIKNIKHYPEFEETVATWLFNEWGFKRQRRILERMG